MLTIQCCDITEIEFLEKSFLEIDIAFDYWLMIDDEIKEVA
jgi:hypothetical protein